MGTTLFLNGHGDIENYPEALRWFQLAAAQGHIASCFLIAHFYHHGYGICADVAEAIRWYRRAAAAGHARAAYTLTDLLHV
jgi:TPR repeat protein